MIASFSECGLNNTNYPEIPENRPGNPIDGKNGVREKILAKSCSKFRLLLSPQICCAAVNRINSDRIHQWLSHDNHNEYIRSQTTLVRRRYTGHYHSGRGSALVYT